MKKVRKIFILVSMLFIVIALTACGELDAIELMERSAEAQEEANIDSMRMELDAHMIMSMMGMTMEGPMTMIFEIESEDRLRSYMSVSIMDEEIIETVYVRDGYEYVESNEAGNVQRTRSEVGAAGPDMLGFDEDLTTISEEWIEDSEAETTDDGYRLEFAINAEGMMEFLEGMDLGVIEIDDFSDLDDESEDDDESEGPSMTMVMYIDEDYLPTEIIVLIMGVEITVEEADMEIDVELEMTMTLTVEDVTIDFPDWLDEIGNVEPISKAELVGTWEWDLDDYMYVFNADGTGYWGVSGIFTEFTWEINDGNILSVDKGVAIEDNEIYLDGDALVFLNYLDLGFEFRYIRTTDFEFPDDDDDDDDEEDDDDDDENGDDDDDTADSSIEDLLVGIWEWDGDEQVLYTFRPEGMGIRMGTGVGSIDVFDWYIDDGNLHLELEAVGMFGIDYETWGMTLEGDALTLESLQGGGTYHYTRSDFLD